MKGINCKLIADVSLISGESILLVKYKDRNRYDHQSGWFLPDDIINEFEHPEIAASRILFEQIRLSNINPELDHIESFKGKDSTWHLVFHYKAYLKEIPDAELSEDLETLDWFSLDELPDKKEVAHNGWALYTIKAVTGRNSGLK
ncbi:MAG: NUDIX hydrolase [Ignavibacteria bacterium]|nr:NUDIX hydrolase [Ignavibacteria bacterium]